MTLEDASRPAQVVTAAVAIYLAFRAWRGEDARLQVVGVDVHLPEREECDAALVSPTVFNASSRGNVVRFVEIHRRRRDGQGRNLMRPFKTEKRLVPDYAADGMELPRTYVADVAVLGACSVPLPVYPSQTAMPIGLAPFETKVITLLRGLPSIDREAGDMLIFDVFDARRRSTRARNFMHAVRVHLWSRLVPRAWLQAYANRERRDD